MPLHTPQAFTHSEMVVQGIKGTVKRSVKLVMYNSTVSERHMDFISLSAYERMEGQCLSPFCILIGRMVKKI